MNKGEFADYIAQRNNIKKSESEKIINIFTDAVIGSVSEGKELSLIGFGSFSISKVAAREGLNPKTKEKLKIEAHNQVRFKVGQKLKDACNGKLQDKKAETEIKPKTKDKAKEKNNHTCWVPNLKKVPFLITHNNQAHLTQQQIYNINWINQA